MRTVLATLAVVFALGGDHHTHQPVVRGFDRPLAGVRVEVRAFPAPTIVVQNGSPVTLEVLDDDGIAFLRIGPEAVEANVESPAFYRSEAPSPEASIPSSADGGAPRWARLVDGGDWAWFEHRITAMPTGDTWSIPVRYGDEELALTGGWEAITVPAQVVSTVHTLDVEGLEIAILPGRDPGLFVRNDTGTPLEIAGPRGEPFLRIGPDRTERATPDGAWEVVAPTPRYGWVDARVGWQAEPPDGGSRREWRIPATLGDDALHIEGEVEWVPVAEPAEPDERGGARPVWLLGVVPVALVLGELGRRRRQANRG